METRRVLGESGEDLAAALYRRQGFAIVDRNYRCRIGELDIVARKGSLLVFCEVKTRSSDRWGDPSEAVGAVKQGRLRRLAGHWLATHRARHSEIRFDVVSISALPGAPPRVVQLTDAF
ncbi:MAG: YraN family protein [Actinomycetota bacterium]|nr:YraN family protein [Actinomycetota bacterium]